MIAWPILIAVIGLLVWALGPDRIAQVGWVLFQCGTFWAVAVTCGQAYALHLG